MAAVSIRGEILEAVIAALKTIKRENGYNTDVAYVSTFRNISHPEELDKNQFPACFPLDVDETKEGFAIFSDEADNIDTVSELQVVITSMVYDRGSDTFDQRTALMQDIEKAIVMNTTLFDRTTGTGLLMENASPVSVQTDKGYFGEYSIFDQVFSMKYGYNHSTGG
jgi:hypothetical protein